MQRTVPNRRFRRRASVVVQVAVATTVVFGMGALAIDIGMLYTAQNELQVSADAAALAAATELGGAGDVEANAVAAANEFAGKNKVLGLKPKVTADDVEFGHAEENDLQRFYFEPGGDKLDAVRVTVRRYEPEGGGEEDLNLSLAFATALGFAEHQMQARSAAVLVPRDIAVVIDLSRSMLYDSMLKYWNRPADDGGYSNMRDIWCALDGPAPSKPYVPADGDTVDQTEYEFDTGPTYGYMTDWGSPLNPTDPNKYDKNNDPGLWYIRRYYNTSDSDLSAKLAATGYNDEEISRLMSGSNDSDWSHWTNRCGVLLGLAQWRSGVEDGSEPPAFGWGDGDNSIENSEVTWVADPEYAMSWDWKDWIHWNQYSSQFKRYYGLKTLVDYTGMSSVALNSRTDLLYQTPQQPLQAVKDAVWTLVNVIDDLESLDQISLEVFDGDGRHKVGLKDRLDGYHQISDTLYAHQAGHYDLYTNIGGGLYHAVYELSFSPDASANAAKVIVLMSDGEPNRWDSRGELARIDELDDRDPEYWDDPTEYALDMARVAAKNNMLIYTVSVGYGADTNLMSQIASIGRGQHFYAAGDPQQYTAELEEIFRTLGGKRPVALIE